MLETLKAFNLAAAKYPEVLAEKKEADSPIVAYTGNYIPPEVIRACGAEPYPEWRGGDPVLPDAMLDESIRFLNPFTRSTTGAYRLGMAPVIEMADLIAWCASDCHNQRMGEMMESYGLNVIKLGIPTDWKNKSSYKYYKTYIGKMIDRIVAVGGHELDEAQLAEEVKKTNHVKELLDELSDLRLGDNPTIGFDEYIQANHDAAILPPEEAAEHLKAVIAEAKTSEPRFDAKAPRLLMLGRCIAYGDYTVVREIERGGATVVDDMFDEALIWRDAKVNPEGDVLDNLLRALYLDRLPSSNMEPAWAQRMDEVERRFNEGNLDGVIFYELLYDEIYDMEYTCLAKRLAQKKIPLLCITSSYEYSREAMLPLQTRIESFIGQLKTAKKGA